MTYELTTIEAVKRQIGIKSTDFVDDQWLDGVIGSVSAVIESETSRWFAPRDGMTLTFDAAATNGLDTLRVPRGLRSLTYLGVANADQPDDGSGTYTEIVDGVYLRGRPFADWPATRVQLGSGATSYFPTTGFSVVKVTGDWGFETVPPRVAEIATIAVVRAFRARSDGSTDIALPGLDGTLRIMRRIAPAEMEELLRIYATETRPAFASVSVA